VAITASFKNAMEHDGEYVPSESARADWEAFGADAFRYGAAAEALKNGAASGQSGQAVTTGQGGDRATAEEKKKKEQEFQAQMRQALLERIAQIEADLEGLYAERDQLRERNREIEVELRFLAQFDSDDDLYDRNGDLRTDVAQYLRDKGKKPENMNPAEIIAAMEDERSDLGGERASNNDRLDKIDREIDDKEAKLEAAQQEMAFVSSDGMLERKSNLIDVKSAQSEAETISDNDEIGAFDDAWGEFLAEEEPPSDEKIETFQREMATTKTIEDIQQRLQVQRELINRYPEESGEVAHHDDEVAAMREEGYFDELDAETPQSADREIARNPGLSTGSNL